VHGKNFIQDQAQARLEESVTPYQQQGLNALGVDYHEVYVYLKNMSSRVCTCKQVQEVITEMDITAEAKPKYKGIAQSQEIRIDWNKPLFGEPNEAKFSADGTYDEGDEFDLEDEARLKDPSLIGTSIIESSPDCGVCFRSGFVPGFEQYGRTRYILTTQDIVDQNSVNIDRSVGPHVFERLASTGWVLFSLQIPKYFKSITYSVRNGHEILNEQLWNNNVPLTLAELRMNAGRNVLIKVKAKQFTHVDITFDLGSDPIHANIAQMSKVTDWTQFVTIGNLNIILPMTIPELPVGSFLYLPKKSMGMRITDVPQLRTASGRNIDWAVNTRVLQPQEPLLSIAKGFRLF
jgi:hypothetical protein